MSEPKTPETPDNGWIAPLVRSIMNRPPIVETAGPLRCPNCGCDHQQFRGLGVFRPTDDGTKLIAVFPTADSLTTIDLPEDVKVGTTIYYVRYICMCNGHHWADVRAYYEDHTATWCVQLADDQQSSAKATPGVAATECSSQKLLPLPTAVVPKAPQVPELPGLAGYVQSLAANPTIASLTGGNMLPILVLPMPVAFPVPMNLPSPVIAPAPAPLAPPVSHAPAKEPATPKAKQIETPPSADAFWLSWNKGIIGGKTEILLPQLPAEKGPHFYVADKTYDHVKVRRDWIMRMALDVPKDVAKIVWCYILWHDRLLLVLNTSSVSAALQKRILEGIKESLVAHNQVRVHAVVMYKKADYIKMLK